MKRKDRIKLNFSRNWNLPGKERLSNWIKPSAELKSSVKNGIVWLTNEDIAINTSADNYIEWSILSSGSYESEIGKLISISLKQGYIAMDIGANIGIQTLRMSQCVGANGKVYAFEPLNHLQEKFRRNVQLNNAGNVTLFPFALSDSAAEANFKIDKDSWNQGTFSIGNKNSGNKDQHVIVKVADEIEDIENLPRLDLIKIDVEGFEYNVLLGLKNTLHKHKPRIIFEYDSNYWLNNGKSILECYNYLKSFNYMLYQITSVGCESINKVNNIESGNIFCIQELNEE